MSVLLRPVGADGERGTTITEVVVAMALTAVAATALVGLLSSSARITAELADDDPLVVVAADQFTRDVRSARSVRPAALTRGGVSAIDVTGAGGTVRWALDATAGTLTREVRPAGGARPVLRSVDVTGSGFDLLAADGSLVPVTLGATRREACASAVTMRINSVDGSLLVERTVAVRPLVPKALPC